MQTEWRVRHGLLIMIYGILSNVNAQKSDSGLKHEVSEIIKCLDDNSEFHQTHILKWISMVYTCEQVLWCYDMSSYGLEECLMPWEHGLSPLIQVPLPPDGSLGQCGSRESSSPQMKEGRRMLTNFMKQYRYGLTFILWLIFIFLLRPGAVKNWPS